MNMMLGALLTAGLLVHSHAEENQPCHAISKATTDAWCQKNCNWTPPNCPPSLCKCGPPGPAPTPGPPPPPPAPSPPTPHAPMSPEATVNWLNQFYMGYDENNPTSPLGVTMTMTSNLGTFYGNIYCSTFNNPHGKTGCHSGFADCRLSASLYNHKMIVDGTGKIVLGLNKVTGYVLNQTRVEQYLSKCSYNWDGASQNRLNRGCGIVPPIGIKRAFDCNDPESAFHNFCPSIQGVCSLKAKEVREALCQQFGGNLPVPFWPQAPACMFPGPALDWHDQASNYTPGPSNLRDMAWARVQHNQVMAWNEVVIDETLMLKEISEDPAQVVTAFVYSKKGMAQGSKSAAEKMRDEYCTINKIPKIPVVMVDDETFSPTGPFKLSGEESILI